MVPEKVLLNFYKLSGKSLPTDKKKVTIQLPGHPDGRSKGSSFTIKNPNYKKPDKPKAAGQSSAATQGGSSSTSAGGDGGFSASTLPVSDFPELQPPDTSAADALAAQVAQMQQQFMQSMQQQQQMFQEMQTSQAERMEALQQQMAQQQVAMMDRPQVAGVKMATGAAGTPMQIAKRGVTGAFGRRGMRISSLNV